ncbi:hypothetical protein JCM8547_003148 [Rhodosporidiobolus lusitaniae]
MSTIAERIKVIEDEMARTQKNKATSFHLGQLKAKLAKLKRELLTPTSGGGGGGGGLGFDVARTGIASVGFIGFPSVGKSSLMSGLTGTESVAAAYEFTTLTTVPGTLSIHGAPIQILDLPGIIEGAKDGKGRGRQVIAVARTCNLIFIVLDVLKPLGDKSIIENELEGFGIRLNKQPPNISLKKKDKGGIAITNTQPLTKITHEEIKAVLNEYRMANCDVHIRCDPTVDEFIDVVEGGRVYIPCVYVLNKIDAISIEELDLLYRIPNSVPISVKEWLNIDELLETMWDKLALTRVYTKPRGVKVPDYSSPVILKKGRTTVEDFCREIHKDIAKQVKYATVWGTSVVHSRGQKVGLTHELADEDVISLVKRQADPATLLAGYSDDGIAGALALNARLTDVLGGAVPGAFDAKLSLAIILRQNIEKGVSVADNPIFSFHVLTENIQGLEVVLDDARIMRQLDGIRTTMPPLDGHYAQEQCAFDVHCKESDVYIVDMNVDGPRGSRQISFAVITSLASISLATLFKHSDLATKPEYRMTVPAKANDGWGMKSLLPVYTGAPLFLLLCYYAYGGVSRRDRDREMSGLHSLHLLVWANEKNPGLIPAFSYTDILNLLHDCRSNLLDTLSDWVDRLNRDKTTTIRDYLDWLRRKGKPVSPRSQERAKEVFSWVLKQIRHLLTASPLPLPPRYEQPSQSRSSQHFFESTHSTRPSSSSGRPTRSSSFSSSTPRPASFYGASQFDPFDHFAPGVGGSPSVFVAQPSSSRDSRPLFTSARRGSLYAEPQEVGGVRYMYAAADPAREPVQEGRRRRMSTSRGYGSASAGVRWVSGRR